jgi:hypothetical protein
VNLRFTLILFLAFVALAVFAFTLRDTESRRVGPGAPTATPEAILELNPADVQEVVVEAPAGSYTLRRVAGGWEVDGEAAGTEVDGVVSSLANPPVLRVLPETRKSEDYGFDTPTLTVTLKTAAGDEHVLVVGDDAPADPQVFVRLADGGPIVLISKYDVQRLKDWLDTPPLAPTATPMPTDEAQASDEEEDEALVEEGELAPDVPDADEDDAGAPGGADDASDEEEAAAADETPAPTPTRTPRATTAPRTVTPTP